MSTVIYQDLQARIALLQARERLQRFKRSKQVQLGFEDLANSLWLAESQIATAYYPFLADMGAWGHLGSPSVAPLCLHRRPTNITVTPLGSGLPVGIFAQVPADPPSGTTARLLDVLRRAQAVRR